MLKSQKIFQKIIVYVVLIMCVAMFVYSLGIMTDPYRTLYYAYDIDLDPDPDNPGQYEGEIKGLFKPALLLYQMQDYNDMFVGLALGLICCSLTMFFVHMHTRRRYYIGNFISVALIFVYSVSFAGWAVVNIAFYRDLYAAIDVAALEAAVASRGVEFVEPSMLWFDLGYVVCALLVLSAIALVINLIWKVSLMKKEDALLNGEKKTVASAV